MTTRRRSKLPNELLLQHCLALVCEPPRPTAEDRLNTALGRELARRLVAALSPVR